MMYPNSKSLNVLVPLAGLGSRFEKAGYSFPKPLIDIEGNPMITKVIKNLIDYRFKQNFIFICREEHYKKYDLQNVFKNSLAGIDFQVIQLKTTTEGAACTALMASDYIDTKTPLIIANSDQLVDKDQMKKWYEHLLNSDKDAEIMVFKATHPKWSYVRLDKEEVEGETEVTGTYEGMVVEVAEKKVISKWATTGIYFWKNGSDFVNSAETMIANNVRVNDEFYIAPTFNEMILKSKIVGKFEVPTDSFYGLGTPEDLNTYLTRDKNN